MRAFSIRNPWAALIMNGAKTVETRSFRTSFRGRLAIHASRRPDLALAHPEYIAILTAGTTFAPGCVLGTVEVYDCVPVEELRRKLKPTERLLGDYSPGRFGWLLRDPQPLPVPVPARGRLSFWEWDIVTNKEAR